MWHAPRYFTLINISGGCFLITSGIFLLGGYLGERRSHGIRDLWK